MTTDRNKVRCAVEVFLDAKRVTLFLDWDITREDSRAKAVEYLTDLWLDLEEQIAKQFKPEGNPDKGYGGTVPAAPLFDPSTIQRVASMPTVVFDNLGMRSTFRRSDVIDTTGSVADETLRPLRHTSRTPSTFLPTPELRGEPS